MFNFSNHIFNLFSNFFNLLNMASQKFIDEIKSLLNDKESIDFKITDYSWWEQNTVGRVTPDGIVINDVIYSFDSLSDQAIQLIINNLVS